MILYTVTISDRLVFLSTRICLFGRQISLIGVSQRYQWSLKCDLVNSRSSRSWTARMPALALPSPSEKKQVTLLQLPQWKKRLSTLKSADCFALMGKLTFVTFVNFPLMSCSLLHRHFLFFSAILECESKEL
jgi:hypothetical protein